MSQLEILEENEMNNPVEETIEPKVEKGPSVLDTVLKHSEERFAIKKQITDLQKEKLEKLRLAEEAYRYYNKYTIEMETPIDAIETEPDVKVEDSEEITQEVEPEKDENTIEIEKLTKRFFGTLDLGKEETDEVEVKGNE